MACHHGARIYLLDIGAAPQFHGHADMAAPGVRRPDVAARRYRDRAVRDLGRIGFDPRCVAVLARGALSRLAGSRSRRKLCLHGRDRGRDGLADRRRRQSRTAGGLAARRRPGRGGRAGGPAGRAGPIRLPVRDRQLALRGRRPESVRHFLVPLRAAGGAAHDRRRVPPARNAQCRGDASGPDRSLWRSSARWPRRACRCCRRRSSRTSCSTRSPTCAGSSRPTSPRGRGHARQPDALSRGRAAADARGRLDPRARSSTLVEAYLHVQQIRMGRRLAFAIDVPRGAAKSSPCRR